MNSTAVFANLGLSAAAAAFAANLVSALLAALVCWIVIRILTRILFNIFEKTRFERGMKNFMLSAAKVGMWFIAVIIIAGAMGIEVASLVAVLSVAGLALSLSIQGIMSNVFSGVTVLATHPFVVGDYVELNGVAGTVSAIGLFYTSVKTVDNKTISIPNSEVTSAKVINYTHEALRRVDLAFTASYDNSTEQVKGALMAAMEADSRVLRDPAPFAGLLSYKDSSIEYVLRAWVKSEDYWDVYFALNEAVREEFKRAGVEMTYNHLNVHVVNK
ncbi:MAG: mechanosensitive ion channel family protein [Candidatus Heteroscillospira sp.]|jgi:small conductance mechanosensitive channel